MNGGAAAASTGTDTGRSRNDVMASSRSEMMSMAAGHMSS